MVFMYSSKHLASPPPFKGRPIACLASHPYPTVTVTTSGAFGVTAVTVTVGSTVKTPELTNTVTVVSMTVTTPGTGCCGALVTVTTTGAGDSGAVNEIVSMETGAVVDDDEAEIVIVGVEEGHGAVIVMTWTECDDVAVGLQGTVTVLIETDDPDNGAATLELLTVVLAGGVKKIVVEVLELVLLLVSLQTALLTRSTGPFPTVFAWRKWRWLGARGKA